MKSPNHKININVVRVIARKEGYKEIYFNEETKVLSFSPKFSVQPEDGESIRINIYWEAGVVTYSLNHPEQGKKNLFKKNMDVMQLQSIFQSPPMDNVEDDDSPLDDKKPNQSNSNELEKEASEDEDLMKCQLELLSNEMKFLKEQKNQFKAVVDDIEEKRLKEAALEAQKKRKEEKVRKEQERIQKEKEKQVKRLALMESRGKYLDHLNMNEADHIIKSFDETVISMACGGKSTIMLFENGSWACTSGLPTKLFDTLEERPKTLPSPSYVAVGSLDRYYVQFKDGTCQWNGCDKMKEKLKNETRGVKSVAFGEFWDSFFIVFDDGFWCCYNIPEALDDLIKRRKRRGDLRSVTLGPNGEYYMSAKNGMVWCGGTTPENLNNIWKHQNRIKFVDFGDEDSYILRYS